MADDLYARTVFFVKDAERSRKFYTETLGFSADWPSPAEGPAYVCQVSLFGFELILNQTDRSTEARAGHGRVFIGLDDDQSEGFRRHLKDKGIKTTVVEWGAPTLVIRDLDENELFIWLPPHERETLAAERSNG